jgi:hypothetical protein
MLKFIDNFGIRSLITTVSLEEGINLTEKIYGPTLKRAIGGEDIFLMLERGTL